MIKNKKFFITGGAGFIGSNLIKKLIPSNEIVVYDNLSRNALKQTTFFTHPNLHIIQGDILDYEFLKTHIPQDIDFVLHMAAIAGVDNVIKNPTKTIEVNLVGTYNILKSLKELNILDRIERFVNFSTSEVFGINAFRVEEDASINLQPVGEARWTYAVSKLTAEHLVLSYYKQFRLKTVTLRPFNIYGPGQVGEGAIHQFVIRAIKNEPLIIHGDGDQIRSWCYIDDMVEGILLCLEKEEAIGEVFNIGNPKGTITILSLAEKIIQLAKSSSPVIHVSAPYVDVNLRIPSISKAREKLCFEPKVNLNDGIKKTIEWYKNTIELI
ncbi:MAG TPA: GDP-mannose 4,6-dehydratase [bacterium]|nr:GDP-mannose 4,6-dehydratase [bacterium]HOL34289.1 GDP-mannose 4,6-dehydratase [bacterium]HPP07655.1 GDP-mannose 4,6-dehydratase [bacterium]